LTKDIKRETRTLDASKVRKMTTKVRIKKRKQKSIKERNNTEKYKRKKERNWQIDRQIERQTNK
jgi:ribosomal protein S30